MLYWYRLIYLVSRGQRCVRYMPDAKGICRVCGLHRPS